MLLLTILPLLQATIHNHTAAIGLAIAAGGVGLLFPAGLGYIQRTTPSGKRLARTTDEQRRGVPFVNRSYYQMRWAGRMTVIGATLVVIGVVWFVVAEA